MYIAIVNFGSFGKHALLDVGFLDTCIVCLDLSKERAEAKTAIAPIYHAFGKETRGLMQRSRMGTEERGTFICTAERQKHHVGSRRPSQKSKYRISHEQT